MPETPNTPPGKISPQAGFGAISGITISATEKFLKGFHTSFSAPNCAVTEELLVNFLQSADSFASQCSDKFAGMLRQSSSQAEVRETSDPVLSRLVRNRCFESLDLILVDYLGVLQQYGVDLSQKAGQLADSRVREGARQVLALGAAPAKQAPKVLTGEGKGAALVKIREYLNGVENLPHELLDYGAIKLFGGDVDFVLQKRFLQNIKEGIQEKLNLCLATVEGFDALKQKMWEDQRAAETAAISAAAIVSVHKRVTTKTGFGAFVIGVICLAPIGILLAFGAKGPYAIGGLVLSGILALVFLCVGTFRLIKG